MVITWTLLIATLWLASTGFGAPLRWAVRTHPGMMAGLPYQDYLKGTISSDQILEAVQSPDYPDKVRQFLDLCQSKLMNVVIVDGFQPELPGIYFHSDLLEKQGWKPLYDVLGLVAKEASARGLKVGVDLTEWGIHARGLYEDEYGLDKVKASTAQDLQAVLQDLSKRYGISVVTEEEFSPAWIKAAAAAGRQVGFEYVHRGNTDDIVGFTGVGERTTPLQVYPAASVLSSEDYRFLAEPGQENGVINGSFPLIFPGHPRAVEASPWFEGATFLANTVLFRSITSDPDLIALRIGLEGLRDWDVNVEARAAHLRELWDPKAPVMNLVVLGGPPRGMDAAHAAWLQLVPNLAPVLLGCYAAGMRPLLTGTPLSDAAAYYVYLAGPSEEQWTRVEPVLAAAETKPVIVQLGAAVPPALLRRVMAFLGVPKAEWHSGKLPGKGMYKEQEIPFWGPDFYGARVPTGYVTFMPQLDDLLMADRALNPMIYRNPQSPKRFFVNGTVLDRQMGFPISQLLTDGRGLQKPAVCLIALGKSVAFWALQTGEVDWINPRTDDHLVIEMKANAFFVE